MFVRLEIQAVAAASALPLVKHRLLLAQTTIRFDLRSICIAIHRRWLANADMHVASCQSCRRTREYSLQCSWPNRSHDSSGRCSRHVCAEILMLPISYALRVQLKLSRCHCEPRHHSAVTTIFVSMLAYRAGSISSDVDRSANNGIDEGHLLAGMTSSMLHFTSKRGWRMHMCKIMMPSCSACLHADLAARSLHLTPPWQP